MTIPSVMNAPAGLSSKPPCDRLVEEIVGDRAERGRVVMKAT